MKVLDASRKYLTTWLLEYTEEYFALLYHDVGGIAKSKAKEVFEHGRSLAFYGGRGTGKTTLMQGILMCGLEKYASKDRQFLPVNVLVTGANTVTSKKDLELKFYQSILAGFRLSLRTKSRLEQTKQILTNLAPWLGGGAMTTLGVIFPPVLAASGAVHQILERLTGSTDMDNMDMLVASNDVNHQTVANQIIREMEDKNITPIFVIDELDKVTDDALLSGFFEGQQGWFQGKRCIISLSFTYGQSVKDATTYSVRRFCALQKIDGVTEQSEFDSIIQKRLQLGISEIESKKNLVKSQANEIMPDHVSAWIINSFAPHINLMLEATYNSVKSALDDGRTGLRIEDFQNNGSNEKPTELGRRILDELTMGAQQPSELAITLNKKMPTVSRILTKMKKAGWVGSEGTRSKKYFIQQKGESARHR